MRTKLIKENQTLLLMLMVFFLAVSVKNSNAQELLDIDRALEIALENSPDMKQVELSLVQNQERLKAQRARLKTQISLTVDPFEYDQRNTLSNQTGEWYTNTTASTGGTFTATQRILPTNGMISLRNNFSYDYNKTNSTIATSPTSEAFNNQTQLVLSQPIFHYNEMKMNLQQLEMQYENSLLSYLQMKLRMELNVAQSFYSVYSQQERLRIAQEELQNNEESYEIIKNKVEGGLLAEEELYQNEVNLMNTRSSVYNSELSLENAKDQFKILIGMPLDADFLIMANVVLDTVEVDLEMAIQHALENRMELRQSEINLINAEFSIIQAKATNEFSGSISAAIGIQTTQENFTDLFSQPTSTPSVGVSFNVPIFDWGERKATIKAAEASKQSVEIDIEEEKKDIEMNIRQLVRSLKNLENQVEIQQKTVENAQLTYDINLEKYNNGDLTSLDLGMYTTQLSDAKLSLTGAIIDYRIELLNLKIQALYDFENKEPIIPDELTNNEL